MAAKNFLELPYDIRSLVIGYVRRGVSFLDRRPPLSRAAGRPPRRRSHRGMLTVPPPTGATPHRPQERLSLLQRSPRPGRATAVSARRARRRRRERPQDISPAQSHEPRPRPHPLAHPEPGSRCRSRHAATPAGHAAAAGGQPARSGPRTASCASSAGGERRRDRRQLCAGATEEMEPDAFHRPASGGLAAAQHSGGVPVGRSPLRLGFFSFRDGGRMC